VKSEAENFDSHIRESFSKEELRFLATSKIFITGGTGFTGTWIVSIISRLFEIHNLPRIVIVSRSPKRAQTKFRNHTNIEYTDWGNLNRFGTLSEHQERAIGFHASVPAASGAQIKLKDIAVYGNQTKFFANWLGEVYDHPTFVNLSSGAVYERPVTGRISETQRVINTSDMKAYNMVKINDERIVFDMTQANLIFGANPRLFSFSGPGIGIPGNFALGSFVNDALQGRAVQVTGSGSSERSYMSPIDMGIWILKSSIYPRTSSIHIGSPQGFKVSEIASMVSQIFGNGRVEVAGEHSLSSESYVPETQNTEKLFKVQETIALERSLNFWKQQIT
jgi:nucleoside-diphosphate-sugar epimerase